MKVAECFFCTFLERLDSPNEMHLMSFGKSLLKNISMFLFHTSKDNGHILNTVFRHHDAMLSIIVPVYLINFSQVLGL